MMDGRLAGKRVLVVEDEYFIASDLTRALGKAGAVPVGPVNDVDDGLALVAQGVDAAILDVNLEGARAYPLADALATRQVPYVFVTGYDSWALPHTYRGVPTVPKPFRIDVVIGLIERLIAHRAITT